MLKYHWQAIYVDGTVFNQYNENGAENKYEDIQREKLVQFNLIPQEKDSKPFILHLDRDARLIYRRQVHFQPATGLEFIIYMVGWQKTIFSSVKNTNVKSIYWLMPDGAIISGGNDFIKKNPLFDFVLLREE